MIASFTRVGEGSIAAGIKDTVERMGYTVELPSEGWTANWPIGFSPESKLLVNTTGRTYSNPPHECSFEEIAAIVSVNLTSAMALTSEFVRATRGQPGLKTIIHIGSLWSRKHATNSPVYTAAKAGLAHYIACMGYELNLNYPGEYTIIGIHPGNVQGTPMTKTVSSNLMETRGWSQQQVDALYSGAITPQEIGEIVGMVIGNKWLNGENIYLGGGDKR